MKTSQKIAFARMIYGCIRAARATLRRDNTVIVSRNGIVYELDLSEGIDLAIYLNDFFERDTKSTLRKLIRPSSLVLDIGANIGAHTLHLANLVGPAGRVLAFEPTEFAFRKLSRNLDLNPLLKDRVTASQSFLTYSDDTEVPEAIYSSWPLEANSDLHAKHLGRKMTAAGARSRRLDDVLSEHADRKVQLVKLDVDGFECDVLRGASDMLSGARPIVVTELAPHVLEERGSSLDELLSFFVSNGYAFYDERSFKPLPSTAAQLRELIPEDGSINVVASADRIGA